LEASGIAQKSEERRKRKQIQTGTSIPESAQPGAFAVICKS
jgi:hypothetical protein